ncbi:MAG: sensor histidine kinase, partial [Clostridia bacterium]|nr:sensor histidine kinase [Clostridia bacterium]
SLLWRFIKWLGRGIAYAVKNIPLYWRTALVWGGLGFLVLLALLTAGSDRLLWLWLLAEIVLTPLVVLFTIGLRRLEKGGEELAKGNLDYRIPTRHLLPALRKHAENLNSITDGMQRAVHEQMKSERMKTELITNVSHDIKTPLTSIISYVKLLERDGLQSENAPQYLEVLDRQSARLKKLTDDLVEASKASSGAMQVNLERTDLHLLLAQVMGEYAEKLTAARLTPVLCLASEKPFVTADGRLLWRVFDNVFSNLCKYAQPETRVYIETARTAKSVTVSIKNISREPLNISGDELMERFVRGDASRNTEGSGLGLSIAQSLMALQNGSVAIDIDGDLFKLQVTIPAAA